LQQQTAWPAASATMGADDDKAQQEERVLQWLKKRGYTEVAKHYEEEQQQPAEGEEEEQGVERRVGEANQNALLFRSVQLVRSLRMHCVRARCVSRGGLSCALNPGGTRHFRVLTSSFLPS